MEKDIKKKCSRCKKEKLLDNFHKDKSKNLGVASNCKVCKKDYQKEYYDNNKKELVEYQKKYIKANKSKIADRTKKYREANREKISKQKMEYKRSKLASDPVYKLSENIRRAIAHSFTNGGYKKTSRTYEILGCSFKTFLEHLNNNSYRFSYEDDGFDIDHIIPISSANSKEELLSLNHYSNLQLLPSYYNRQIKRDKKFCRKHFENWYENTNKIIG